MRILGADVAGGRAATHTVVALGADGRVDRVESATGLPGIATAVAQLSAGEPFLLGVDVPVLVPAKPARRRPVETLVRRRFGTKLAPGGRASLAAHPLGVAGEALLAGLAAAGLPCLPYPDRDRRKSGLAETHPALILKSLLWESGNLAEGREPQDQERLFRAYEPPPYRAERLSARAGWSEQAVSLDLLLRALAAGSGLDLEPVRGRLARAGTAEQVESVAALLDAVLIASTARRYLEAPESSLFLGDQDGGYVILPADAVVRRLALVDTRQRSDALFPPASLREHLGASAKLRDLDLLRVPGRAPRMEAEFGDRPRYEFDNRDEMLWWKHCRHAAGPTLPTEGLEELQVRLLGASGGTTLRLVRSRHATLSFRFVPPEVWRHHVPTRDGRTYPFEIVRAVYATATPASR